MEHLIADSGLQFFHYDVSFNPSLPLTIGDAGILKYSFVEKIDEIEGYKIFSILYENEELGKLIPIEELLDSHEDVIERNRVERETYDEKGMIKMLPNVPTTFFTCYDENGDEYDAETGEGVYSMKSLIQYRVVDPNNSRAKISAFELLLGKWLPMPMFRKEDDGISSDAPMAWCRMKITRLERDEKTGVEKYRLIYAFDTQMGTDQWDKLRPFVSEEDNDKCEYSLCNRVDLLVPFLSSERNEFHAFADYIAALLGIDTEKENSFQYKAFYIYFLNYIRLLSGAAPEVTLYNVQSKQIDVDLVLDIGNSRTCGILFEENDFRRGKMLEIHDLSNPDTYYENKTFDMRVAFRKADFGGDIVLDEEMFQWRSFVRIGEEAKRLVYCSIEGDGLAEKTTNYSSPKRYLWDKKEYEGQWENTILSSDHSSNVTLSASVSVPGISLLFEKNGVYNPSREDSILIDFGRDTCHYSRSSLMTFAFIEIFHHALLQINSFRYRDRWHNINIRRVLRDVIITCPTSMPQREQIFLRQSAYDAFDALTHCYPKLKMVNIIPSPDALKIKDPFAPIEKRVWQYDEASCCQLVYLYAEIAERYSGEIDKFFELKGNLPKDCDAQDCKDREFTIGTIDIGAGTTDMMICKYKYDGNSKKTTPVPLFYDSFYLAGDDILRNIIQNIVIEGDIGESPDIGNITSVLTNRILAMGDEEMKTLPCLKNNVVYKDRVDDICRTPDREERRTKQIAFASELVHNFFGSNSSMKSFRDRRCRNDFNIQVSVPIAQKMMDLLRLHRPSKLYSYEELFPDLKPADYLLDYFEEHFGFRFENLSWRFNPQEVAKIIKSTMEPLLKQLALVLYTHNCDSIVLAGRPSSLDAITELFIKYIPVSPDKLVRLNEYRVGSWFPTADDRGYFFDQKSIVAVGAMIGYLASRGLLNGLVLDLSSMIKDVQSTANYMGVYNSRYRQVRETFLSPTKSMAEFSASYFPVFIGCRQLDAPIYQARPIYAIYNNSNAKALTIRISRDYEDDKETLVLEDAMDENYKDRKKELELVAQSLVDDGKYWLDKGEFDLTIK